MLKDVCVYWDWPSPIQAEGAVALIAKVECKVRQRNRVKIILSL
jgi:hypothetical protein